jgi:hypothetical protein
MNEWDQALIKRYLHFYEALHNGDRVPETIAQKHFLAVCQGRAEPQTQHEIAYLRFISSGKEGEESREISFLEGFSNGALRILSQAESNRTPTEEEIEAVEFVDDILLETQPGSVGAKVLKGVKSIYYRGTVATNAIGGDAVLFLSTALSSPDLAQNLSRWAGEEFNTLSNAVTKAMDGDFAQGLASGVDYVAPELHRLFGGHTIPEALSAAAYALPDASSAEVYWEAVKALASDMASSSGLPIVTFTREGFDRAVEVAESIGISQSFLADAVTYNAAEVLGAAVPGIALLFGWNSRDRKRFVESLGALGISALVAANPILLVVIVLAAALDFHRHGRPDADQLKELATAFIRGGALSGIVMGTSVAIGGPLWVGLVVGIVLAILARKHAQEIDFQEIAKRIAKQLQNALVAKST